MTRKFRPDDDAIKTFSDDVGALWCRPVDVLDSPPDSLTFLRDYVSPNVPCIIKNAISSDASGEMKPFTITLDEIICHVGKNEMLTVDVTPDGHGDCVRSVIENHEDKQKLHRRMFVKPHETRMSMGNFRDALRRCQRKGVESKNGDEKAIKAEVDSNGLLAYPLLRRRADDVEMDEADVFDGDRHRPVVYYSKQNDCLRTEMAKLFSTQIFPPSFPFAEQAFGTGPPEAINLWIGNERSVSSMHKDHYENLFYVCSGEKEFLLCPPADTLYLSEADFLTGEFCPRQSKYNAGSESSHQAWVVVACDNGDDGEDYSHSTTRWIVSDVNKYITEHSDSDSGFPLLSKAHPIKVPVSEGEMLYIPSLWYHRVTQTCETVGVNYWFDMKFDQRWCYFNFLQNLKANVHHESNPIG